MTSKVTLDKRWKEILFAASGFGPNLLMVLMTAYFTDAIMPKGLAADVEFWSYGGVTLVSTLIFPILWTIGRIFDGVVDVPLAALTDSLKNKTGKRFITIVISFLPMVLSFILCWIPICGKGADISQGAQIGNSIWIFAWSILFFASYTLALITFYGSLSDICSNQTQRARVSAYKSVFDTISYALVYAAIPAIFKAINIPTWQVALYLSPLMITILIPLTLRKKTAQIEVVQSNESKSVSMGKSIELTLKSKPFMKWLLVNCIAFFGLQMFLVSQNALISGIMNLGAGYAAILNTCAFAPVPLMLFFFNRLRKKVGIRTLYQSCLLSFGIAILSFGIGSQYIFGDALAPKLIIGAVGGVIGSWGIGAFFMVPYLIPTIIASAEEEITHKNHSAMYFAVQALATSIVGAIASSLIYNYIKNWTLPTTIASMPEWKCGVSLVPLIVSIACFAGFFACFAMPKKYTPQVIYNDIISSTQKEERRLIKQKEKIQMAYQRKIDEVKSTNIPEDQKNALIDEYTRKLNIKLAYFSIKIEKLAEILNKSKTMDLEKSSANEEKTGIIEKESIAANVFLFILTGGIFGIVQSIRHMNKFSKLKIHYNTNEKVLYYLALFIPFISIYTNYQSCKKIEEFDKTKNIKTYKKLCMLTSIPLPMFMNVINMAIKDKNFNQIIE